MKKLYLGNAAELRHRTKIVENTEVLKLMHNADEIDDTPRSDILIVAEDIAPIPAPDYKPVYVESPIKTTDDSGASEGQGYESNLVNLAKVVFCATEPADTDVLWAKPVGDNRYQFYAFYNGMWNGVGEGGSNAVINISNISGNVSAFTNDAGYAKESEVQRLIRNKQDTIADLGVIRSNASAGAGAADSVEEIWRAIASITPGSSESDESGLLELSTTNGAANKALLNAALAQGDVKLKKGHYPIDPGVMVDNVAFDLNGACLYPTAKQNTGLIIMTGEKPVIRNGELCGSFNVAVDEPGYEFYESESLIRCYLYGNGLVENVDMHNCFGYAISYRYPDWGVNAARTAVTTANLIASNESSSEANEYLSNFINVPSGYRYMCAYGGLGYTRIISQKDIVYTFYDSNNTYIEGSSVSATPRVMVPVPEGAAKVKIRTFTFGEFKETYVGFFNINVDCLTVKDCSFHNNHSLGMVGMEYGTTRILNCRSYENGKPRKDATANTNTTGFLDIEDLETPFLIMDGCTSEDEVRLAMLGAYKATVTNCHGNIVVYRGWTVNVSNCTGRIGAYTTENITPSAPWELSTVKTIINVSNCTFFSRGTPSVNWTGSNNTFIDCYPGDPTKEDNFLIVKTHRRTGNNVMPLTGQIRGKLYNPYSKTGYASIRNVALSKGSNFIYDVNLASNSDDSSRITVGVTGDCYGITSTAPFYAFGHTIHDSTFTPKHSFGAGTTEDNAWTGEYENCTFNLDSGSMFYAASKKLLSDNRKLIFRNCTINNASNCLFKSNMTNLAGKNYSIKFINCKIADNTKLFAVTPTDFTYEIITEDTDYDARIKALLARIEALEGN